MPRLRTVSPAHPGHHRIKSGRGFRYVDDLGRPLPPDEVERIRALVIPPAWTDVWVCPYPNGHLQAVGTDARGRRQYLYHPRWRELRDMAKHDRVLRVATRLPRARLQVVEALRSAELTRERALATAFRLLDLGYFRMGSDTYTEENGSYGLTTLRRRHVSRRQGRLSFDFPSKAGTKQHIEIADPDVLRAVEQMMQRRGRGSLLAWQDATSWVPITATDVNAYLRELLCEEVSAKDFRTWHGTVHAALALAAHDGVRGARARQRAIVSAVRDVSNYLGNTPAVARSSYVDPRLIEQFLEGRTIAPTLARLSHRRRIGDAERAVIERAVIRLVRDAAS